MSTVLNYRYFPRGHFQSIEITCILSGMFEYDSQFQIRPFIDEIAMPIAKVGRRGQMTLPRDVRKALDVQEGDHIVFVRRCHEFSVQPLNQTLLDLRGSVPVSGPQDFDGIREQVRKTRAGTGKRTHGGS